MIYILYHANCADGLGAAYAAYRRFGRDAVYCPMGYEDPLPTIPDGSIVYILDYCRSPQELLELLGRDCAATQIDHHESALIDALRLMAMVHRRPDFLLHQDHQPGVFPTPAGNIPIEQFSFEHTTDDAMEELLDHHQIRAVEFNVGKLHIKVMMTWSGATLAWNHFHRHKIPTPEILTYIEDRDLWEWVLPHSEAVSEGLYKVQRDFQQTRDQQKLLLPAGQILGRPDPQADIVAELEFLDQLVQSRDYVDHMKTIGEPEVTRRNEAIGEIVKDVVWGNVGQHQVPIVATSQYRSWVGHRLLDLYPDAPFSITYRASSRDGIMIFDLRSRWNWNDYSGFNCRRLAQTLGGGGHRAAAGFQVYQRKTLKPGDRFFDVDIPPDPVWIDAQMDLDGEATDIWTMGQDGVARLATSDRTIRPLQDFSDFWVVKLRQ